MKTKDFNYHLPEELIALYPMPERADSRLLVLNKSTGDIEHKHFYELIDYLNPNDLLVFNHSKVIPARVFGKKPSGGKIEILVERIIDEHRALAHVRSNKSLKPGAIILLGEVKIEVLSRKEALFELKFHSKTSVLSVLENIGHMPLPPYIKREDELEDKERYQTVYAKEKGSVAAPTAGLHFTKDLIDAIKAKGIDTAFLTLHVGAGTFQPVRVDNILEHDMHAEYIEVPETVCEQVKKTKAKGGRVIAVGTTSVRSLETASQDGEIKPFFGDTKIFIYPGYEFQCVDAMVTNFHLPESTLLMLISAFSNREIIMKTYQAAIDEKYRFFSYGDAMLIHEG
jgi:S-adenosylmethionine:tRNA ribosyltransferase-isomerase